MKTTTKIVINNIKYNKSKSVLICISIFLTTLLLTLLGLCTSSILQMNKSNSKELYGNFYAAFSDINTDKLKEIKLNSEITDIAVSESFGILELKDVKAVLAYLDDICLDAYNIKVIEGKKPVSPDEIVSSKEMFNELGYDNPQIGDTIKLKYRKYGREEIQEAEFKISGFVKANTFNKMGRAYFMLVSESYYDNIIPINEKSMDVKFKTSGDENFDLTVKKIEKLAEKLEIDKKKVNINKSFLMWDKDPGTETITIAVIIGIIIIVFSILVIYNIFYVGLIQKIHDYGKLRAIGATKKELKSIVLKEGLILAFVSIPFGLVIGLLGSRLAFNLMLKMLSTSLEKVGEINITIFNLPVLVMVTVITLFTVYLSLRKPMKIASRISPIDATRYQEANRSKKARVGYKNMSVIRVAFSNLSRNKKRTITTILTMGLSCVMFVVVANVVGNMDPEYSTRNRYIEKGDFYLSLDASVDDEVYLENNLNNVQKLGLFNQAILDEIKAIDGVEKLETRKEVLISFNNKGEEIKRYITVLNREDFNNFSKECEIGIMDYDKATKENGLIFTDYYWIDGYDFELSQHLPMTLYDGDKEIKDDYILQGAGDISNQMGSFIMTEDTFNQMNFEGDMVSRVWITVKNANKQEVENKLNSIASRNGYYDFTSYQKSLEIEAMSISLMRIPAYALLFILGIIGFMNMANTMITSVVTRKSELGVLQAIGMTTKQLNFMLQIEGLVFTIGTLVLSLFVGNYFGYLAFLKCRSTGMIGLIIYHFPALEMVAMVVILVILQVALTMIMSKSTQKDSIVDRIRYNG